MASHPLWRHYNDVAEPNRIAKNATNIVLISVRS